MKKYKPTSKDFKVINFADFYGYRTYLCRTHGVFASVSNGDKRKCPQCGGECLRYNLGD